MHSHIRMCVGDFLFFVNISHMMFIIIIIIITFCRNGPMQQCHSRRPNRLLHENSSRPFSMAQTMRARMTCDRIIDDDACAVPRKSNQKKKDKHNHRMHYIVRSHTPKRPIMFAYVYVCVELCILCKHVCHKCTYINNLYMHRVDLCARWCHKEFD